ncbi:MAG: DUF1592 domain-containing protein [Myxococcaceae bacterium]|nr:DUF1592 domain-containing protein [Myxococcaceae bacterium]
MRLSPALLLLALPLSCVGEIDTPPAPEATRTVPGMPTGSTPTQPPIPGMPPLPVTPPDSTPTSACTGVPSPGASPLRRLNSTEYDNTVKDLLGDGSHPSAAFPAENASLSFDNDAEAMVVTGLLAEKYLDAAEALAAKADPAALVPCDVAMRGESACARTFIETFGLRAYRRPLTTDELGRLVQAYSTTRSQGANHLSALRTVLTALLVSPHFLYRVELGGPQVAANAQSLTPYELASRLSYFLWSAPPDDLLFAAAAQGQLSTPDQVAGQARRLLADPRAHATVARFHEQWLGLGRLDHTTKDTTAFPLFATLRASMKAETTAFLENTFWGDGTVAALLTSKRTFVDKPLADFYGVTGPQGAALEPVSLAGTTRAGLLTQASMLSSLATATETSPILRGKFVREQLLCQSMPPPPANFDVPAASPTAVTMRQRLDAHRTNAACSGCHSLMDPIGFGLEGFDGMGRARATEAGAPVEVSGEIVSAPDPATNGTFQGPAELAAKLAASSAVQTCVARQWFRFGVGRGERAQDACSLERLTKGLEDSHGDLKTLLVDFTRTDAFLYRTSRVAEGGTL